MKKIILAFLCAGMILLLSACGSIITVPSETADSVTTQFSIHEVDGFQQLAGAENENDIPVSDSTGAIIGYYYTDTKALVLNAGSIAPRVSELDSLKAYVKEIRTVEISGTILEIAENAFRGCTSIETLSVIGNVSKIGDNAFNGCSGLTSVIFGDSITDVGMQIFSGCSSLTSFTTESNISDNLLFGTTSLQTVVMKDTVTDIGQSAFQNCSALRDVEYSANLARIGQNAFRGCTALLEVNIFVNNNLDIESHAYADCSAVTKLTIGRTEGTENTAITLGIYAFSKCTDLSAGVFLKDGVTELGAYIFSGCKGLRELHLPISIAKIGNFYLEGTTVKNLYYAGNSNDWDKIERATRGTTGFYGGGVEEGGIYYPNKFNSD